MKGQVFITFDHFEKIFSSWELREAESNILELISEYQRMSIYGQTRFLFFSSLILIETIF